MIAVAVALLPCVAVVWLVLKLARCYRRIESLEAENDLSAAFAAAEKVFPYGIVLSTGCGCECCPKCGPRESYDPGKMIRQTGLGGTPALAIRAAILKATKESLA